MVISESFNERTLANLEVALERACHPLGLDGMSHEYRKFIAAKMVMAAGHGATTLAELSAVAYGAARQLTEQKRRRGAPVDAGAMPGR